MSKINLNLNSCCGERSGLFCFVFLFPKFRPFLSNCRIVNCEECRYRVLIRFLGCYVLVIFVGTLWLYCVIVLVCLSKMDRNDLVI